MRSEPEPGLGGELEYAAAYLRFYRETVLEKCRSLDDASLRRAAVPSEWTPLELLRHVVYVERRWVVWGFLGEAVPDPWGDHLDGEPEGRWFVPAETTLDELAAMMAAVAERTEEVLASRRPTDPAALGGRFRSDPPDLRWICFHLLQEYGRHVGHLDIAVELAGGHTGE